MNIERRQFVRAAMTGAVGLALPRVFAVESAAAPVAPKPVKPEPTRGPRQDYDTVFAFVRAGHTDLPKVKQMLSQEPKLIYAAWDWGGGDWETALNGASHIGNRDIARYLISQGARVDPFCAAMLGDRETILALIKSHPATVTAKSAHGYTLLYHVAISGDVVMAEHLKPHLPADADDYNQALSAAVRDGHLDLTKWLFENGKVDPNMEDAIGKRPLTVANEKGFKDVAEELRRRGAVESGA